MAGAQRERAKAGQWRSNHRCGPVDARAIAELPGIIRAPHDQRAVATDRSGKVPSRGDGKCEQAVDAGGLKSDRDRSSTQLSARARSPRINRAVTIERQSVVTTGGDRDHLFQRNPNGAAAILSRSIAQLAVFIGAPDVDLARACDRDRV